MRTVAKFASFLTAMCVLLASNEACAAAAWYRGVVTRVALNGTDGSFILTLSTNALDDCLNSYAYFRVSIIGTDTAKAAYAMALTSLVTGRTMGIVIDKSTHGPGGECDAIGMTSDLT